MSYDQLHELPGVEFIRAMQAGRLPLSPLSELLGYKPVDVKPGRVSFELMLSRKLHNPLGCVHGGILGLLLDTVMASAVHSLLPAGHLFTSLEYKVNFVRPITACEGSILAHGRCVHSGQRIAFAEGEVQSEDEKHIAHGTSTLLITGP